MISTTRNTLRCLVLVTAVGASDICEAQFLHRTRDVRVSPADEITVIDPGTSSEAIESHGEIFVLLLCPKRCPFLLRAVLHLQHAAIFD